jgi:PAS domain S-box-containing protein
LQGRLTLQERLVVLVLVAVLPLAVLSVWFAARQVEESAVRARAALAFNASAVAAAQDRIADSVHHLLGALADMPELREGDLLACRERLAALQQRFPIYANIGFTDTGGRVLCLARGDPAASDASDRAYFRRAVAQRTFVMGEAVQGRATGAYSLVFAMPVLQAGEIRGVVFAALDLRRLEAALADLELPQGTRVVIADRAGQALMVHPRAPGRTPGGPMTIAALREAAAQMQERSGEIVNGEGQPRLFASATTRAIGGERLLAIVTEDRSALMGPANRQLAVVLAATALSLFAGLGAAWWVGGRGIVKPAKQILGTVRRLEQGRLDARVPLQDRLGRSEFSRIGAAFNLMAESLQLRQLDLESELGRSRSAYAVLDTVLNSMQEGLIAVDRFGQFVMVNSAATRWFDVDGPRELPQAWPRQFGLYHRGTAELLAADEMPFARGLRGESGDMLVEVRNPQVPAGRLLRCSFQPMRSEEGITGTLVVFTDVTDLERAEADLVLLRNAIARLNDIVLITEGTPIEKPGPRIVFVNEAFERLTGYASQEALGNTPRMLQGPGTDRAALDRIRAALAAGQPVREELLNYAKDGRPFWVETDIVPLADERGHYTHWIAVQRDVTARKQADRERQEFSAMLQRTAEAAQAVVRQQTVEATIDEVQRQACRVLDAARCEVHLRESSRHEAIGRSGLRMRVSLVGGSGRAIGHMALERHEGAAFSQQHEYVAIELAQLASVAIENAQLLEHVRELNAGLESRIAERTAELARQEKRYRALAEQAPEVVWNVDPMGRLTFVSRAWYDLMGGRPEDWLGHGWMDRMHPDDLATAKARWARSRETLEPYTGTRRLLGADGRWHTMAYRAVPVLGEDGRVEFWVGIDSDITALKAIEDKLRDSNHELEAFSYSVSHDLRAPLGAIGGFSQALAGRLKDAQDDKARHYLSRIDAGVRKMEQLIEALLGLSRVSREPMQPQDVDLAAIARDVIESLRLEQPGRDVAVDIAPHLVARGDARLLAIALQNLLGNAWKFTSRTDGARIEVGCNEDGAFYVRDNGVGFDMAYAGKLFSAFQRLHTESEFPGTGIGLATVRRIVARHEGKVWAESAPGQGTTFYFTLAT